jgi:hypothetical protein
MCTWGEEDSGGQSYFKRNHGSGVTAEASAFPVMERKVRSLFCGRVIHKPVLTQEDAAAQEPAAPTACSRLQIALQRSAYIRLAAHGAIRSGTARYAKWAGDSVSQTHRRSAMCGFTQDDDAAFYCSYNKTWPTAVYPSYEYSPPRKEKSTYVIMPPP